MVTNPEITQQIAKLLTPEALKQWLSGCHPDNVVGYARNPVLNPIANYLRENNILCVEVHSGVVQFLKSGGQPETGKAPLPQMGAWVYRESGFPLHNRLQTVRLCGTGDRRLGRRGQRDKFNNWRQRE
jgi:hypothetical protein